MSDIWHIFRELVRNSPYLMLLQGCILLSLSFILLERFVRLFLIYPRPLQPMLDCLPEPEEVGEARLEPLRLRVERRPNALLSRLSRTVLEHVHEGPTRCGGALTETLLELRTLLTQKLETLRSLAFLAVLVTAIEPLSPRYYHAHGFALGPMERFFSVYMDVFKNLHVPAIGYLIGLLGLVGVAILEARAKLLDQELLRLDTQLRNVMALDARTSLMGVACSGVARVMAGRREASSSSAQLPTLVIPGRLMGAGSLVVLAGVILSICFSEITTWPSLLLTRDLMPPASTAVVEIRMGTILAISQTGVSVDSAPVVENHGGALSVAHLAAIQHAFEKRRDYFQRIERGGGERFEGRLLVIADRNISYGVLSSVLETASRAGFKGIRLLVIPW